MAKKKKEPFVQMTAGDIAQRLILGGVDPFATNNPLGQYGMSNLDYVSGMGMGFGEFFGDTPSLAAGYDVIANRMAAANPRSYRAMDGSLTGIVTAQAQFDPFNTGRSSNPSRDNLNRGMQAAIDEIRTGTPNFATDNDRAHYEAAISAMTGIFGTRTARGAAAGADAFVGRPGTHINKHMTRLMQQNGVMSVPGGRSRFLNTNETLGADELGIGPAIGSDNTGSPAFGPLPPERPGDLDLSGTSSEGPSSIWDSINEMLPPISPYRGGRVGGQDVAGYDISGLAFDRNGNPIGNSSISRGLQEQLRWMEQRYAPGVELDEPIDPADFAGRYAYEGDLRPQDAAFLAENPGATITRDGRYVLPVDYASAILGLDPDASDYAGRYDTSGTPSLEDAWFLEQNPQFTLAKGGANTGYGYTQDPSGAYVPNTGGAGGDQRFQQQGGAEPTPVPGDWNYIPKPGDWNYIPPRSGYDPATGGVIGAPPAFPSASSLNGFDTPTQGYTPAPYTPTYQDTLNASTIGYNPSAVISNPSALASTIPGFNDPGGSLYNPPAAIVPSFGNPIYQLGNTSLGGSGISPSSTGPGGGGFANPYGADPNFSNPGGQPRIGIIMPNTLDW